MKILMNELNMNYGAIYENVVAQELKCHGFDLYYYNNNRLGELDFYMIAFIQKDEVMSDMIYKPDFSILM